LLKLGRDCTDGKRGGPDDEGVFVPSDVRGRLLHGVATELWIVREGIGGGEERAAGCVIRADDGDVQCGGRGIDEESGIVAVIAIRRKLDAAEAGIARGIERQGMMNAGEWAIDGEVQMGADAVEKERQGERDGGALRALDIEGEVQRGSRGMGLASRANEGDGGIWRGAPGKGEQPDADCAGKGGELVRWKSEAIQISARPV
jgi:hypothetical protein